MSVSAALPSLTTLSSSELVTDAVLLLSETFAPAAELPVVPLPESPHATRNRVNVSTDRMDAYLFIFSNVFLCFLAVTISRKISAGISPYRVFAIADGLIGLCVIGYAVYDIVTDTAFFAGIVGVMLLVVIFPATVLLLLADFLVWKRNCG